MNRGSRNLFRDKELLKILCNSPSKFVRVLRSCASGSTADLCKLVDTMCKEAKTDDGLVDVNLRSPSKAQKREACQLLPGADFVLSVRSD